MRVHRITIRPHMGMDNQFIGPFDTSWFWAQKVWAKGIEQTRYPIEYQVQRADRSSAAVICTLAGRPILQRFYPGTASLGLYDLLGWPYRLRSGRFEEEDESNWDAGVHFYQPYPDRMAQQYEPKSFTYPTDEDHPMPMLEPVTLTAAEYAPFNAKEAALLRKGFGKNSYPETMKQFKKLGHDDPSYLAWRDEQEGPWWLGMKKARDRYPAGSPEYDAISWFIETGTYPFAETRLAGPEAERHMVAFYNAGERHWHTRPDPVWPGFRAEVPYVEGGLSINWVVVPSAKLEDYRETAVRLMAANLRDMIGREKLIRAFFRSQAVKVARSLV